VKTVSNGNILTEKVINKIITCGIDMIEFSLDGMSIYENDHIRIKCNGKKVIENIKLLIEKRNGLKIKKPVKIFISNTQFVRDGIELSDLDEPMCPEYIKNTLPLGYDGIAGYKTNYAMVWPHMGNINNNFNTYRNKNDNIRNVKCDMLNSTITIRWNGEVVPCCYDLTSRLVMGNVKQESLFNIWNNSKYNLLRRSINSKKYISICNSCSVVNQDKYLVPKWVENKNDL